jgi:hypothetical protein
MENTHEFSREEGEQEGNYHGENYSGLSSEESVEYRNLTKVQMNLERGQDMPEGLRARLAELTAKTEKALRDRGK